MVTVPALRYAVEDAFAETGRGLEPWPDPHPDREPLEEEYSRSLDPGKWRIVAARADAWCAAAERLELAGWERDVEASWADRALGQHRHLRVDRLAPYRPGAVQAVLAYAGDEGMRTMLTLGLGDPAVVVALVPVCGCDACDSGSQDALDELDEHLLAIVDGSIRHLRDPRSRDRTILALPGRWSASGLGPRTDVASVLADPAGWHEVSGTSWLT